jgi:hypothetical protein
VVEEVEGEGRRENAAIFKAREETIAIDAEEEIALWKF